MQDSKWLSRIVSLGHDMVLELTPEELHVSLSGCTVSATDWSKACKMLEVFCGVTGVAEVDMQPLVERLYSASQETDDYVSLRFEAGEFYLIVDNEVEELSYELYP